MRRQLRAIGAIVFSMTIFAADAFTSLHGSIALAYVIAIMLIAPIGAQAILASGVASTVLTILACEVQPSSPLNAGTTIRLSLTGAAFIIAILLLLRERMTRLQLAEQARMLELSHDTVIIRDKNDTVVYWNDGAEQVYGWTRIEAIGKNCGTLLQCVVPSEEIEASLGKYGQWSGHVERQRRDGSSLTLASSWCTRRDVGGRAIGVIESSVDVTAESKHETELQNSEQRYRAIFEATGYATWESDWTACRIAIDNAVDDPEKLEGWLLSNTRVTLDVIGKEVVRNANAASIALFQAFSEQEIIGSSLCSRYTPESNKGMAHIIASLHRGCRAAESEVRLSTLGGCMIDVVLRAALATDATDWSSVLVMACKITEQDCSYVQIERTSSELAHAARVALLGQLSASIAHEVNQPLTAIINYARAGESWLARGEPDLSEVSVCLSRIVTSGYKAADVIRKVKSLAKKNAPPAEAFDLAEVVDESFSLMQYEARSRGVRLRQFQQYGLPFAFADRVQIQQVLVNLIMNGMQAMQDLSDRETELHVYLTQAPGGMLQVDVKDAGAGFPAESIGKVFDPFFSTKMDGMGMGLSICQSIVESHGGTISAMNNEGCGATVTFSIPQSMQTD